MNIRLHKNATTTPRIRALVQASDEPQTVLARRFGVSVETVARRKRRDSVEPDGPPTALELKKPWPGYDLGFWSEQCETEAQMAVEGRHYEIGEAAKLRRVKATDENTGGVT